MKHAIQHIHFIGIGGSGLSAIARLLKESGYEVTGSDNFLSPFAAALQSEGIKVLIGHHSQCFLLFLQSSDYFHKKNYIQRKHRAVQYLLPNIAFQSGETACTPRFTTYPTGYQR